jgi:hypothetical protein
VSRGTQVPNRPSQSGQVRGTASVPPSSRSAISSPAVHLRGRDIPPVRRTARLRPVGDVPTYRRPWSAPPAAATRRCSRTWPGADPASPRTGCLLRTVPGPVVRLAFSVLVHSNDDREYRQPCEKDSSGRHGGPTQPLRRARCGSRTFAVASNCPDQRAQDGQRGGQPDGQHDEPGRLQLHEVTLERGAPGRTDYGLRGCSSW